MKYLKIFGLGTASTVYQKRKYQEYQAPQKKSLKFLQPPNYIPILYIYLKTLKYMEMTPKTSPIL